MTTMNRTLPIFLILAAAGADAFAQQHYNRTHNRLLDEANAQMAHGEYLSATKIYKKLIPVDTTYAENYYSMGYCLSRVPGQRDRALAYLEKAVTLGHTEAHLELALARHRQQRFEEAIELLVKYKTIFYRAEPDAVVDRHIAMARSAKELVQHPVDLQIRNMGGMINSAYHDYCPLVTADGNTMYFTSRREGTTGGLKDPNGQYMEDIYVAHRIDEVWSNATNAGVPLNTYVQDATVGLSPDGETMIIYRTAAGLVSGDLFECRKQDGLWQPPALMTDQINSSSHEPSASISPDGNEIYFTSDRPGGFGGRDLYRIRRLPNGQWSLPLNLGPTVNTPFDEDAPFLHSDGVTLFFSSTGHGTMGGYDIFKTQCIDPDMNGWSLPENMGYPLNTVNDDIYFCLSEDGTTGYFSSERTGGLGAQDIYQVNFPSSQIEYVAVLGVVTDTNDEPVRARMTVMEAGGEEIVGVYNANANTGRYLMILQPGSRYHVTIEAEGFERSEAEWVAQASEGTREMPLDIVMLRNENTARAIANE